mgnify:CR=1 FL=1
MNLLRELLNQTIKVHFSKSKFNIFGKLEWYPPTDKEIKKTFEKRGIKISQQRVRYFKTDEFEINSEVNSSVFYQLLISQIEEDGIFYCVSDHKSMGNVGQKIRYKFQIKNFQKSTNPFDYKIELLEEEMIMTR